MPATAVARGFKWEWKWCRDLAGVELVMGIKRSFNTSLTDAIIPAAYPALALSCQVLQPSPLAP